MPYSRLSLFGLHLLSTEAARAAAARRSAAESQLERALGEDCGFCGFGGFGASDVVLLGVYGAHGSISSMSHRATDSLDSGMFLKSDFDAIEISRYLHSGPGWALSRLPSNPVKNLPGLKFSNALFPMDPNSGGREKPGEGHRRGSGQWPTPRRLSVSGAGDAGDSN